MGTRGGCSCIMVVINGVVNVGAGACIGDMDEDVIMSFCFLSTRRDDRDDFGDQEKWEWGMDLRTWG